MKGMEVINLIGNILQMLIIPFLVFIIRMNMTLEKIKVETENHKKKIDKLEDYQSKNDKDFLTSFHNVELSLSKIENQISFLKQEFQSLKK